MNFLDRTSIRIMHARFENSTNLPTKLFTGCSLPSNRSAVLRLQPVKQALPSELRVPHDIHLLPEAVVAEMPLVHGTNISLTTYEVSFCEAAPRPPFRDSQRRPPLNMIPRLAAALAAISFLRKSWGAGARAAGIRIHRCYAFSLGRLQPEMSE